MYYKKSHPIVFSYKTEDTFMKYLFLILISISAYAGNEIQMKDMDINGFVDDELVRIQEEHDKAKYFLKTNKKKNSLLNKTIKTVKKLQPERVQVAKNYKKYSKINNIANEYLDCINKSEDDNDCEDLKNAFDSISDADSTQISFNQILLLKLNKLKNITLESFPSFSANVLLKLQFNDQGDLRFAKIDYSNSYFSHDLAKFEEALIFFINKYGVSGPSNRMTTKQVIF